VRWLIVPPFDRPGHAGVDFADELRGLGHEVDLFAYRRENVLYKNKPTKAVYQRVIAQRLERRCAAFRPDVVLVVKGGPIAAEVLHGIRSRTGALLVNVFPDNPLWMIDFQHIEAYDLFFTKERYAIRQLRMAGLRNVHYLAPYCVPAFHHPVVPTEDEQRTLEGIVAMVGAWYPYRERFLREIAHYPVKVWGPGWRRAGDPRVRALVMGGSVGGRDKLAIYSGARLSLNLHHPMNDVVGVNTRTFELAAAGACQIVDLKDDLPALFKPDEEVVAFHDLRDLRRALDHYLGHPDEAHAIGQNARRRALAEHTLAHRIGEILSVAEERFGVKGRASDVEPSASIP
jgi:spore maturation protein CgeB